MRVHAGYSSDIGKTRERQEDAYLTEPPLYAVADGMGGHRGGDVASVLALETLSGKGPSGVRAKPQGLAERIQEANRTVFERALEDRSVAGMGTTITAAIVEGNVVRLGHVGDSRAYLLRAGTLRRLTEDHTLVHLMVKQGQLTEDEAAIHPQRSVLTRALGTEERVRVDEGSVEVRDGDRLLLCTDGLTAMVSEDEIQHTLENAPDPQQAAEELVRSANAAGGMDNITVVVLDVQLDENEAVEGSGEIVVARGRGTTSGGGARGRRTWLRIARWAGAFVALVILALVGVRLLVDRQWYVGVSDSNVAVYRGIPATVAGFRLSHVEQVTTIPAQQAEQLVPWQRLPDGITADTQADAATIVANIRAAVAKLQKAGGP